MNYSGIYSALIHFFEQVIHGIRLNLPVGAISGQAL
jgi:hypothetical protein